MNTPESESSGPEPSGLQVELGAMSTRRFRAVWLVPLFVLLAVGSVTLFAWLPSSSPALSPMPSATLAQSPSTQPKITWSENQIEVILSPGESTSKDLTFTSDLNIQNIVIEPVPTLAPFVSVQPNSFADVPAGQPQSVRLLFSIPQGTALGTYDGTVHVRLGSQTLPQTLKIAVKVWVAIEDASLGIALKVPPDFLIEDSSEVGPGLSRGKFLHRPNSPSLISIHSYSNSGNLSLLDWFNSVLRGHEFTGGFGSPIDGVDKIEEISINGISGLQVTGVVFGYIEKRIFFARANQVVEVSTDFLEGEPEPQDVAAILGTLKIF